MESSLEKQESINDDNNDTLLAKDTDTDTDTDDDDENNDDGEGDNDALNDEEEEDEEDDESDEEDDDSDDEDLQKLQGYEEKNVLVDYHPEVVQISEEELQTYSKVVRDNNSGKIVDPFHKTIPIMTKYEKAKVIGIRAQQINSGSEPFIPVDVNMIDGLSIANQELLEKKIPFIIRRPMPNGSSEYWNINDLELLE